MAKNPNSKSNGTAAGAGLASGGAAAVLTNPSIVKVPVTDPAVLDQARVFAEALTQLQPIAEPGSTTAAAVAQTIREGTATPRGIAQGTAERYVISPRSMDGLVSGANPTGKTAEVVAISDYRSLHSGHESAIVNPPKHVATNVSDIRLAPDPSSRKDLIFGFETKRGGVFWKYNGQVKTGGPQYVADKLVEMSRTPGYGKIGYVDARYVNVDGTPRVGPAAFTEGQARRLSEAKVRLRGIPNLEKRAELLMKNISASKVDGLDPAARQELQQLRDDIAAAYRRRGAAGRIGGGMAVAAASAAIVSILVQLATDGKVDAKATGQAAGAGAVFGAGGAAADVGLYHLGVKAMQMTPEAAKDFAQQGVAVGFCVLAIGMDLVSEFRADRRGEVTVAGAIGGAALKAALDLLPLVMAPLGFAGLPVLVASQVGGRWLIAQAREADRILDGMVAANVALAEALTSRMETFSESVSRASTACASTDELYRQALRDLSSSQHPGLRLVKI